MTINEWQTRLQENFLGGGETSDILIDLGQAEQEIGNYYLSKFHGSRIMTDSFVTFFGATLLQAYRQFSHPDEHKGITRFGVVLADFTTLLRRLRAADNLLYVGYPLMGFALLRDVRDQACFIAAVMGGHTTFDRLDGKYGELASGIDWVASTPEQEKMRLNNVKSEENKILRLMLSTNNASPEMKDSIEKWKKLFHLEVHGSKLTGTQFLPFFRNEEPYSMLPQVDEDSMAMYMNRTAEMQWMLLRILPFLQVVPRGFGPEWSQQWVILDESLRYMVLGLNKEISKGVADIVDTHFAFDVSHRYRE